MAKIVPPKNPAEIEKMRVANRMVVQTYEMMTPHVNAGITTQALNDLCHDFMVNQLGAKPAPLNYRGFPKSICTSVNHGICHGIPNDRKLKDGDIIGIDISLSYDGYYGDSCVTYMIGKPSIQAERIVRCAKECLYLALMQTKPGFNAKNYGKIIEDHAAKYNYSVVREFCGHGIGTSLHEEFEVLHYYEPRSEDVFLEPGMTFTIEPMINVGSRHVKVLPDGWTAVTKDHSLSAQFEHTILVTDTGYEVLTQRADEVIEVR